MEIGHTILTPHARLSRSLKVTGTDMDRAATYDFLLVIHINHGLSRTVAEIKSNIYQIFPPPVFNSHADGLPFGIL